MMNVLSICDRTGNMVAPWIKAGHRGLLIDVQHHQEYRDDHETGMKYQLQKWSDDITKVNPGLLRHEFCPDIIFAFPPCTDLAVSGARWFRDKGMGALIRSLQVVESCRIICEYMNVPYMIENPVSTLSTYWREPDYIFDPCDYGGYCDPPIDAYTKKTCLWTGGGFIMPEPKRVDPVEGSRFHLTPPGPERGNIRSVTPMGFAIAVYEANKT